jgi:hypothetical protein
MDSGLGPGGTPGGEAVPKSLGGLASWTLPGVLKKKPGREGDGALPQFAVLREWSAVVAPECPLLPFFPLKL